LIYVDTSVALATLFNEPRRPLGSFWQGALISSRLLEYEIIVRINGKGSSAAARSAMTGAGTTLLSGIVLMDLSPPVVARALVPFPVPVRTLDALHLATLDYLRNQGSIVNLATYDTRLAAAAKALGFPIAPI
jgi:hypothetical protein